MDQFAWHGVRRERFPHYGLKIVERARHVGDGNDRGSPHRVGDAQHGAVGTMIGRPALHTLLDVRKINLVTSGDHDVVQSDRGRPVSQRPSCPDPGCEICRPQQPAPSDLGVADSQQRGWHF